MSKTESFSDLIGSIQEAFLAVNELSEKQHVAMLEYYFDEQKRPETMEVNYPYFDESGEIAYKKLDIPLLCLVPISSLKINEVDIDFKVKLSGKVKLKEGERRKGSLKKRDDDMCCAGNEPPEDRGGHGLGYVPEYRKSKDGSYADISLKFRAEEAPEGLIRIRDELIKILP